MRPAVASGVSAAGTLALAQRLLFDSRPDWPLVCPLPEQTGFHWASFTFGLLAGLVVFALIEAFVTAKWAVINLVRVFLEERSRNVPKGKLYRFLDEPSN